MHHPVQSFQIILPYLVNLKGTGKRWAHDEMQLQSLYMSSGGKEPPGVLSSYHIYASKLKSQYFLKQRFECTIYIKARMYIVSVRPSYLR